MTVSAPSSRPRSPTACAARCATASITWLRLGGPACAADAGELEDAEVYLDALEKLEEAGEVDFARLAELLEELYAPPDPAATESDLQIMTIHKAKGLEFGTVILPGLHRPPGKGDAPLMRWKELAGNTVTPEGFNRGSRFLLLAPIRETGGDAEPAYEYLKHLDREAEDTEAARLLYVAATRAEHRLHLLACPMKTMPPRRSLLACAWPVAEPVFEGLAPPVTVVAEPAQPGPFILRRLPAGWTRPAPPPAAAWTAPPEGREGEPPPFDWAKEPARLAGIVAHRWLQRIGEDELRGWDAARVDLLRSRVVMELKRAGVPPSGIDRASGLVIDAIKNALGDERGRWILGPHPFARSEHKICTPLRKRMRIDRYIEEAQGVRWIVDFKTGEHSGGSLEAYLDDQVRRYAPQLDEYARATGATRRALYFPLLRGWREW